MKSISSNQTLITLNPLKFIQNNPHSMVMSHIEEVEIVHIINFLNNSSPGWDGIPSLLAKAVIS